MIFAWLPLVLTLSSGCPRAIAAGEVDASAPPATPRDAHPSAAALGAVGGEIRALLRARSSDHGNLTGAGPWGDRGDLMGLLVRLAFHDAATFRPPPRPPAANANANANANATAAASEATGGADGCVDLASAENGGLREAIDLLEGVRRRAADRDEGAAAMSRADVWALAGNVAIEEAGGPRLEYRTGRADADDCAGQGERHVGAESTSSAAIEDAFVRELGLTHGEVVALIGAHVLGKATEAHSGYEGKWVPRNDAFTNAYFVDLLHVPWSRRKADVPTFGERTTWQRFEDRGMSFGDEIMLQTDVDLAFQTTGGYFCGRVGGAFVPGLSCPNATHAFAPHVWEFARDEEAWREEFAEGWAKLASMTASELRCAAPDCRTPGESFGEPTESSGAPPPPSRAAVNGLFSVVGILLINLMSPWRE